MNIELIAILVIASVLSIIGGIGLAMLFRICRKTEEVLREMRKELRK